MKYLELLFIYLRGFVMGMVDMIPGVSGGTIAFITGIYERLIDGIKGIDFKFVPLFFRGRFKEAYKNFLTIDFFLFIPLMLGIVTGVLTLARVIEYLLETQAVITFSFFFGLILASAVVIVKDLPNFNWKALLSLLIGCIIIILFIGLNPLEASHSLPIIFLSGSIAICGMVLPGISGAFILLLLGQYEYLLNSLNNFIILDILAFILGGLLGVLLFARLLSYLLKKYKTVTIAFLMGMMLGGLRVPYERIAEGYTSILPVIAFVLIGMILVFSLEFLRQRIEKRVKTQAPETIIDIKKDIEKSEEKIIEQKQNEDIS